MKKAFFFFLMLSFISSISLAQIDDNSLPFTFRNPEIKRTLSEFPNAVVILPSPNLETLKNEDEQSSFFGMPNRIGVNLKVDLDLVNDGSWVTLSNGDRLCRLEIQVKQAKALGLYFSQAINIPTGADLYVFNAEKNKVLGSFKDGNEGFKALEMLPGEKIVLEYKEKVGTLVAPIIKISDVVFFYRDIDLLLSQNNQNSKINAENCQVDAACSEGNSLANQKRATVFYTYSLDGNTGSCTATMINNTSNNCAPYILSAAHCGLPESGSDISEWVWYWNYEKFSCQTGSANQTDPSLPSTSMSGGTVVASALNGTLDNGFGMPEVQGSDFVLIELNQRPPTNFNAFLAGWNRTTLAPANGKSLHHPSGSAKKVATTTNFDGDGNFWYIQWTSTSNGFGMMEPGSSGAPIFNSNGQIIGNCSWSLPDLCTSNQMDGFGKFSTSWSDNGAEDVAKLAPWLDPLNSGSEFIDGIANTCSTASTSLLQIEEFNVFPNPFSRKITIQAENWKYLTISDLAGKQLDKIDFSGTNQVDLPLLNDGIYLLELKFENGQHKSLRIVKI